MEYQQDMSPAQFSHEEDEIAFSESSDSDSSDVSMSAGPDSEMDGEGKQLNCTATGQLETMRRTAKESAPDVTAVLKDSVSKKRKFPETYEVSSRMITENKKAKRGGEVVQSPSLNPNQPDLSLLPPEIWHRIFTFTPPRTLGNLLLTNKLFNVYLDPTSSFQLHIPRVADHSHIAYLKPDAIWRSSRRGFWPRMPSPLQEKTELDMWQLACQDKCQFCSKNEPTCRMPITDQWHPGLGTDGTKIVWTFTLQSCGPCLLKKTIKEIDLLLSPSFPSVLLPGLPFVFITDEIHVLSPDALQGIQVPSGVQLTKIFLSAHVDQLVDEFNSVKSLGGATVEEWLKGLEDRGKQRRSEPSRWEKWAAADGVVAMRTLLYPGSPVAISSTCVELVLPEASAPTSGLQHTQSTVSAPSVSSTLKTPCTSSINPQAEIPPRPQLSIKAGIQHGQARVRTRQEVLELKAARRAEIERRAMDLQPPLTANVLAHIPSFQAAIQIISPLDDNAWGLLKPRLVAQRAEAERRERREQEAVAHSRSIKELLQEHPKSEITSVETKQLIDKNWDDAQAPLRTQISAFADEIIQDGWDRGLKVNKENSPPFAVDVLLYVRKRFYAEIAKDAAAARTAGQEPACDLPGGPFTQKLTLENMKWLFDVKIRPHTEIFRKELFFCNGCEGNTKMYGFEGVVQHYAAKHTNALSRGSVVVHWRAEWPEIPPFKPDPQIGRKTAQNRPHTQYDFSTYPAPVPSSSAPHQLALYNPPSTGYGQPASWDHDIPPQTSPAFSQQPIGNNGQNYNSQPAPYSGFHSFTGEHPIPQGSYPVSTIPPTPAYPPAGNTLYGHNYHSYQTNSQLNFQSIHNHAQGDLSWLQLEDLARNSRDLWTATAGLKEVPGSLRVHVVIYHIAKRFRLRFSDMPPLTMFIHGLSHNKEMRPVRNVNGLMCKACNLGLGNGAPANQDRTSFSLPQLVNHFQQKHIEPLYLVGAQLLDWTADMVFIPDTLTLSNLRNLAGMDGQKFGLFCEAFPELQYHRDYSQGIANMSTSTWSNHRGVTSNAHELPTPVPGNTYQSQVLPVAYHQSTPTQDSTHEANPKPPAAMNHELASGLERHVPDAVNLNKVFSLPTVSPSTTQSKGKDPVSPDNYSNSIGTKLRNRKTDYKERQKAPGQISKNRKGVGKLRTPGVNAEAPGEPDRLAEEEQHRQEEKIRAMWAADRAEAARLISSATNPPAIENGEWNPQLRLPLVSRHPESPPPRMTAESPFQGRPIDVKATSENPVEEPEDEDLTADLVSYLNQQEMSSSSRDCLRKPENGFALDTQHTIEGQPSSRGQDAYVDEGRDHEHQRARPPTHTWYESRAQPGQYRQRSPIIYHSRTGYDPKPPSAAYPNAEYEQCERGPQGGYYRVYAQEQQRRSPVSYTERYELVRVRDSRGEYYIRRPVGRDSTRSHFTYEADRSVYNEAPVQYRAYEDFRSERPVYEAISRISAPPRERAYLPPGRATSIAPQTVYDSESSSRHDAAAFEEYDPRFPAAPSGSSASRYLQYQQ